MASWYTVIHHLGCKIYKRLVDADDSVKTVGDLITKEAPGEWGELHITEIKGEKGDANNNISAGTKLKTDMPIDVLGSFGLKYLHVWLATELVDASKTRPSPLSSAIDVLMSASKSYTHLPPKRTHENPSNRDRQFNRLLELLEGMGVGFLHSQVGTNGKQVVGALADALWYIDPHHTNFNERYFPIPAPFDTLRDMYDYKANHKPKPMLSQDGLQVHLDQLSDVLMLPWFANSRFMTFKSKIEQLAKALKSYVDYLIQNNKRHRRQVEPVRSLKDTWDFRVIEQTVGPTRPEYVSLEAKLAAMRDYEIVYLCGYEPELRYDRKNWLERMTLTFPVAIYRHVIGGCIRNLNAIWKIPIPTENRSDVETIRLVNEVKKEVPLFSTRIIRKEFLDRYIPTGIKPAILRDIYRFITSDQSSSETAAQSEVDARLVEWIASACDSDLFYDMRKLNGRPEGKEFQPFWDELDRYLEEVGAVDDRRHDTMLYLPFAISIRDLREQVVARLPSGTPVPSESWIRLNFSPVNPFINTAKYYTGRFKVKYSIQQRLARIEHEDAYYCGHMWKMMRELAIKWREQTVMVCVDDKAVVPVGEPGHVISTGVRAHHGALTLTDGPVLACLDHDFHTCGVVPSVALQVNIPETLEGGFYSGTVHVTLKDKVLQPSSAARHASELVHMLREQCSEDGVNLPVPILMVYSDGGPDHRTNYISVKVAATLIFIALDLDFYCAARTAPHGSWLNPAERVMSTLNLALQNVALCRDKMDPQFERSMKSKSTMSSVRNESAVDPDFGETFKKAMQPVLTLLETRFRRLQYKGNKITIGEASRNENILEFMQDIGGTVDENFNITNIEQMKNIAVKSKKFKTFMDKHSQERHYTYQLKKCPQDDDQCWYCVMCPPRMSADDFSQLHFLPDSVYDKENDCFKPFKDVYGTDTNDDDRPSLKEKKSWSTAYDKEHSVLLVAAKVRDYIICHECLKRRVIYSKTVLTTRQQNLLKQVKEEMVYSCGAVLFPVGHQQHHLIVVREGLRCKSPMETTYYSGTQTVLEPCCTYCAGLDIVDDELVADLQEKYGIVRPICNECFREGKKPVTRSARKGTKRRRGADADNSE